LRVACWDEDENFIGSPGGGSPTIARFGSIAARRAAAYSFDSSAFIGMFATNVGSATYVFRSAAAQRFRDRVQCDAELWPIAFRSKPSRMLSASSMTKPCELGGHSNTSTPR
jgi:hypothetical protein